MVVLPLASHPENTILITRNRYRRDRIDWMSSDSRRHQANAGEADQWSMYLTSHLVQMVVAWACTWHGATATFLRSHRSSMRVFCTDPTMAQHTHCAQSWISFSQLGKSSQISQERASFQILQRSLYRWFSEISILTNHWSQALVQWHWHLHFPTGIAALQLLTGSRLPQDHAPMPYGTHICPYLRIFQLDSFIVASSFMGHNLWIMCLDLLISCWHHEQV